MNKNSYTNKCKYLFVHGAFGTGLAFRSLIEDLKLEKKDYLVFQYSVEKHIVDIIRDLNTYIKSIDIDLPLVIIAHSLGGLIAKEAIEDLNKVVGLITIASPFKGSDAALMMSAFKTHPFIKSISSANPIFLNINLVSPTVPIINIISTVGNNPMISSQPNDGVVSIFDQEALNGAYKKYYLEYNHNEILQARETSELIKNILTKDLELTD